MLLIACTKASSYEHLHRPDDGSPTTERIRLSTVILNSRSVETSCRSYVAGSDKASTRCGTSAPYHGIDNVCFTGVDSRSNFRPVLNHCRKINSHMQRKLRICGPPCDVSLQLLVDNTSPECSSACAIKLIHYLLAQIHLTMQRWKGERSSPDRTAGRPLQPRNR